jgi:CheY-like chemotaxis protein
MYPDARETSAFTQRVREVVFIGERVYKQSIHWIIFGSAQETENVRPDVLICDLAMPEMDGYELLENVRRLEPQLGRLPVIAFTAAARSEDQARTRRAGFEAHLTKPLDPNKLVTTILQLAREHT